MKISNFAAAFAFAATLAAAPAFAQSTSATTAPMQGMSSPAAAPAATMAPAMAAPGTAVKSAVMGKMMADQKFKTPALAAAHCPGDQVVWSTFTKSKVFHTSHSKYYGKTKHGAYVCEKEALAAGYHKAKN
ncbi:hypothetical protein [Acidocella sp.]|uniref:hypothetical protein n=1 Tax=Acidocella sp. TaxID=50710 RepID=UPI00261F889B|nr:hypothetical protein [Acidocella sp.]